MSDTQPKNTETAGGSRYSEGKTSGFESLPVAGLLPIARVAKMGGEKYAPLDWREGQSFSTLWNCMWRHIIAAHPSMKGLWSINEDDGTEYHLAHAAWNLVTMLAFMEMGMEEMDDITPYEGVTADELREAEKEAEERGVSIVEVLREDEDTISEDDDDIEWFRAMGESGDIEIEPVGSLPPPYTP